MSSRKERIEAAKQYLHDYLDDIEEELAWTNRNFPKEPPVVVPESNGETESGIGSSSMIVYAASFTFVR